MKSFGFVLSVVTTDGRRLQNFIQFSRVEQFYCKAP